MTDIPAPGRRVALFGGLAHSLVNFRGPLIQELIRRGHEVFTISGGIDEGVVATLRGYGAHPVSIQFGRTSLNPAQALKEKRRLTELLKEIKADVLLAYTIKPIVLGVPAARKAGVERIVSLVTGLGYAFTGGREPKRLVSRAAATVLYRRAFSLSDLAVFQNPDDRADFARMGILPRKTRTGLINGSGVDVGHFAPSPPPASPSFLLIARLLGDKGVREYGQAARRLKQLHPQVRISLAGPLGHEPDAITPQELQSLVDAGVDYLGPLADVRPAIAEHSVYVLPSYREGTPRSVLEALAIGRAIVTTDAPGCRETVAAGINGLLVPPRDAGGLEAAMLSMIEQPQLLAEMGRQSRQIAEQRFDVHKVNADLLRLAGL